MKSFLKIFKKGKDKWQYGDNTTERANSDTYETFHENESDKAKAAWNPAAAASYLTILEAIHHKTGQLPLSNISPGFEAVKVVEAFLSSKVDKKFVEAFDANVLFSAAMQILEVTEALLWEHNCEALLRVARITAPTEGKNDGEIVSSVAPHSLQVLGGLLAFSEIMARSNPSNGFTLADKLAVRLLPHFSNRQKDLHDAFPYLMGHYREYFSFGQQFATRLVGASSPPEEVTVQEWVQYSKRKMESTDSPSAPESPSFSGVRDSTKVMLNRVDSSVDFAIKRPTLSEDVPESKGGAFNTSSARLVGGIATGKHSTDEAESKGVEYKDDAVPNDEGVQYFKSDSDLSDTDSKSIRNKKLTPIPQPQNLYAEKCSSYLESNDFDDDSIEDIGLVDIKEETKRPVITQEKSKPPDDSILSIPELEESSNRHEKESVNSWDEEEEEEEEQPAKQTQHAPPPIFSPPMLAKTSNANKWKTEKMYTFDESDSDEGAAEAEANNGSDDINDIPSLSDNIGHDSASSVVEVPKVVKHPQAAHDSKLFVLTTLDISRDSESAYDKESNSFVNRTFSLDEPVLNNMKDRQSGAQTESRFAISNSEDTIDSGTHGNKPNELANPVNQKTSESTAQAMTKVRFEDSSGDQPPLEHKDVERAPTLETSNVQVLKVPSSAEKHSRHDITEKVIVNQAGTEAIAKNTLSPPTQILNEPSENFTLRNSEELLRQSNTPTGGDETDSVRSDGSVAKKKKKGIFGFMNKIKKTFSSSRDRTNSSKDAPLSESTSSLVITNERESVDIGIAMREASQDSITDQPLQKPVDEIAPSIGVADKSASAPAAMHQPLPIPIPEQKDADIAVKKEPAQTREDDGSITLLVHDETEKSIHELFDHLKRRDSSASISSFDSNLSSRSLDHANKKAEQQKRLSNPALKSKSVLGTFKNVFRLSSSNKGNALQGKKDAAEPIKDVAIANNAPEQGAGSDVPSARLSSSQVATNNNAEEKSDYGDEMQSMVSSVDSRSVNTATILNKFTPNTNYPKNGIGLAKILRKTNRAEESKEQLKKPPLVAPITTSDAFAAAILKVDHLSRLMNDIERTREELQLVSGVQTKSRAEVLRDDIARAQKNRLQKLNSTAPITNRSEVVALDAMDENTIRKLFNELRNGSSSSSVASTVNIDEGLNYIRSLSIPSISIGENKAMKKENKEGTGVVKTRDIATIVLEPLYGVLTTGIPLPKYIANSPYTARQMSKIAEDFPSDKVEINCPFQLASEWEIACGIHFSGELVKRLPRGNLRRRYFILVVSPNSNPNLTVDSFGTRAAISTTKDETIREVAKKKYNSKLPRDYYLMEYSSCTISRWGKIPIGWKRSYPMKNLMSVHTKTDTQSKGTDFKLIFQAKPHDNTPVTAKEEAAPGPSTEQLQLDNYKNVLQKNIEVGKIESERMRVLELERKKKMPPPPEAVQLLSYMNVLRKNVSQDKGDIRNSNNLTVAAEGVAPIEEGGVESSREEQDGSAENKSGSGDSFEQELYHEFSDIATSLNDGLTGSYIDEDDHAEVDEDADSDEGDQDDEDDEANNSIDNKPGDSVALKDQQAALLNAQREIHKILSQPINRKGNKDIISLALRAPFPDSRMKWVAAVQAAARNEVYLNTLNY